MREETKWIRKSSQGERRRERKGGILYIVFLLYIIRGMGLKIKSFQQAAGQHRVTRQSCFCTQVLSHEIPVCK